MIPRICQTGRSSRECPSDTYNEALGAPRITVAVFRCVVALPLSVVVTSCYLLSRCGWLPGSVQCKEPDTVVVPSCGGLVLPAP